MEQQQFNSRNEGYDAVTAFNRRRNIYVKVKEFQQSEHEVIKRIGSQTILKKSELLVHLSTWLLNQQQPSSDHSEAESLSGCIMTEWLSLQKNATELQNEVNKCANDVNIKLREYNELVHFKSISLDTDNKVLKRSAIIFNAFSGMANKVAVDETKKSQIENLESLLRSKQSTLSESKKRLNENIEHRQIFAKRFLRGCLSNIQELETSTVFGSRVSAIVEDITQYINSEWQVFEGYTIKTINNIESDLAELRCIYRIGGK